MLCGKINSTKSPSSGARKVRKPGLMSQVVRLHQVACG